MISIHQITPSQKSPFATIRQPKNPLPFSKSGHACLSSHNDSNVSTNMALGRLVKPLVKHVASGATEVAPEAT